MKDNRRSLTIFELLLVVCIIMVLWGSFAICFNTLARVSQETALRYELSSLRSAIQYYRIVNNRLPGDLKELAQKVLTLEKSYGISKKRIFVDEARTDTDGDLIDPFFTKYNYDSTVGRIYSQTAGYENW